MINKNDVIFLAGHRGMVGSATLRALKKQNYKSILTANKNTLDLTNSEDVEQFFKKNKPKYVIMAAAKVGGILANSTYPTDFFNINISIQNNIINNAYKYKVKRLIFLGSACIYPRICKQPMKEEYLLTSLLEPTNEAYALAKISGIKLCKFYNIEKNTDYRCLMPNNLYGPNDNFNLKNSHVIPALIRKFYEAKKNNKKKIIIWGSGKIKRDFLHVNDLADAIIFLLNLPKNKLNKFYKQNIFHLNAGYGKDISIKKLVQKLKIISGFNGDIVFDIKKPDGVPRKLLDSSRLSQLGWSPTIKFEDGLKNTYEWFQSNIKENIKL